MVPFNKKRQVANGFTLAELLIALAILGVIATFTIPKVLVSQQNRANISKSKEVAGMIAEAFQRAKLAGTVTSGTKPGDLVQYMNYLKWDTSGTVIDDYVNGTSTTCNSTYPCITLHNGGTLFLDQPASFGGTSSTNEINFRFDPEPGYSGTVNPVRQVTFMVYYDGYITSRGNIRANTYSSFGGPLAAENDPPWFSW